MLQHLFYFHLKSLRIMKKRLLLLLSMALLTIGTALAQRTITGSIKDDKGESMVGASVVVKGTTTGTVSDTDGKFSLNVPKDAATLVVSFTGFASKEVAIGASNIVDVTLEEGKLLEEAVVVAFNMKKDKSNLGYAVSTVSNQELTTGHTTNITNALAAKVPGVRISGSGGSFSSSSITIRGFTSFTGSNQPLFVVDGVSIDNSGGGNTLQTGVTNSGRAIDINQDDVESISVLKGAAATSLYGSRAANGVILITTKTGKSRAKSSVTYSVNVAQQEVNRLPDYQNAYGQGTGGVFGSGSVGSWGPKIDGRNVVLPVAYRGATPGPADSTPLTAFPNNVSDLFKKGLNVQHNLSFQGGNDKSGYRLSAGYTDDNGVLDNNRLQRYNVGINATSEITKKLTAGISVNYSYNASKRTPQGNQLSNPLFRSWFTPRSWDLTNRPYQNQATGANMHYDAVDNPRWTIYNNLYDDQIDRVFGNFNLRYNINDWLSASAKLGADNYAFSASYYDQVGGNGAAATNSGGLGGVRDIRNISRILNSTFLLTANKKITSDLELNFAAGNEILDQFRNNTDLIGRGITVRDFRNIAANTTTPVLNSYEKWQYRLIGFFANATAVYKNWATLDLAVRNDQNSILPKENNSYTYYSVAGTVNMKKALDIKTDMLSSLKLRANYGLVGSAKPEFRYATDSYYSKAAASDGFGPSLIFPFNGLPGFTLQDAAGNPDLKPEFTRSVEGGVEFGLFGERLTFNGTMYQQKSTDVLLYVPNSAAAGISSSLQNAGSLTTNGIELQLGISPIKNVKGFNWTTTFNYTQFKTIVDTLASGVPKIQLGGFVTPGTFLVAHEEYGQIYGNRYQRTNDPTGTKFDGTLDYNENGKIIVSATTGLPLITANTYKIGNPNPQYILGVSNAVSYKGLELSFLVDIKKGGAQYSRNIADLQRQGATAETATVERLNADGTPTKPYIFAENNSITTAGVANTIPITSEQYWGNSGKYSAAEGFIYNTDWVRIREASLSYTLQKNVLQNTPFGSVTVGVFGRNLFLSSPNYPHLDPEQNVSGVSNSQGLEFNALPQTKSMGFNLRVTF
jgi:TonB-linked SusC/RagA family outer membrane protein